MAVKSLCVEGFKLLAPVDGFRGGLSQLCTQGTPTSGYSTFLPQRWQICKIMKNYGLDVTIIANTGGEWAYEQIKKGVGMCI